ncbi:MAG: glycosyltransferase [Bacteroidetes bacterium]|nr:glycosyltransferase [Bacteroidota bacterium]
MNIAAVTILYNFDSSVYEHIKSYEAYVSLLIIIDNSETPGEITLNQITKTETNVIQYNKNNGIAKALNDAVKIAVQKNCSWLLMMDQDSWFEQTAIERYITDFKSLPDKSRIAITGPVFEHSASSVKSITQVNSIITSGSLLNIEICELLGGFDELLFIDEVDHEYCYRAIENGYQILRFEHIFLHHSLGKEMKVTTISGKKNRIKSLHNPIRIYYMVRNYLYVSRKFKNRFRSEMQIKRKDILVRIKNNVFYGKKKFAVVKYAAKGIIDYFSGRMGKIR